MKTIKTLLLALLLANALIVLVSVRSARSNPATLYVPSQYSTIRFAIGNASAGDTIIVASGVYNESNLLITKNGLTLQGEDKSNTIIDGTKRSYDIITVNAENIVIRGFTIRNSGFAKDGISLSHSNNTRLTDNIFSGCFNSIRATNSINVNVTSSTFLGDNGSAGVYVSNSQNGLIESNTFNGDYVGAFVVLSTNFMTRNNTFFSCIYDGALISHAAKNSIVKNTFTSNNWAIVIKYGESVNNTVIGNTISNNNEGLVLQYSPNNNVIHHNNFINNLKHVNITDPSTNVWSTDGILAEGNYWSDYNGNDVDKNGIGDTPYTIATGNQDPNPLIGPYNDFTVSAQTGVQNVYTISNSTITDFSYSQATKQFNFQVSDTTGSLGICRVVFPTGMVQSPYTVYVNGQSQTLNSISNSTHTALYFSYTHGSQPLNVIVVPEFSTTVIIVLLSMLTLLAVVLTKKRKN